MTGQLSSTDIKRGRSHGRLPKLGTKRRNIYDALRRGQIVSTSRGVIERLKWDYGLETKPVYLAGRRGCAGSVLIGEWEGPYFRTLDQILQDDALDGANQREIT